MFKAFLFDLDGTLVNTAPDLLNSLNHVLSRIEIDNVSLEQARNWVGHGARVMILEAARDSAGLDLSDSTLNELHQAFLEHYSDHIADFSHPMEDVESLLDKLWDSKVPMGVVTNKFYELSYRLLNELNLYRYFDVLVGGDSLQVAKPEAEPALYACNELGVDIHRTLFVGDSITDVGCARAAGCEVAVIRSGYNQGVSPDSLGADLVFDSFLELI